MSCSFGFLVWRYSHFKIQQLFCFSPFVTNTNISHASVYTYRCESFLYVFSVKLLQLAVLAIGSNSCRSQLASEREERSKMMSHLVKCLWQERYCLFSLLQRESTVWMSISLLNIVREGQKSRCSVTHIAPFSSNFKIFRKSYTPVYPLLPKKSLRIKSIILCPFCLLMFWLKKNLCCGKM